jgi:hypothetical protein
LPGQRIEGTTDIIFSGAFFGSQGMSISGALEKNEDGDEQYIQIDGTLTYVNDTNVYVEWQQAKFWVDLQVVLTLEDPDEPPYMAIAESGVYMPYGIVRPDQHTIYGGRYPPYPDEPLITFNTRFDYAIGVNPGMSRTLLFTAYVFLEREFQPVPQPVPIPAGFGLLVGALGSFGLIARQSRRH